MIVTDCHCCVIEETWGDIAHIAWAGYLNEGRGLVQIDTTRTSTGSSRPLMFYQPASVNLAVDEDALVRVYDPTKEAVVCVIDDDGRHVCKAAHEVQAPPAIYSRSLYQ